jgi:hypothetical protein
MSFYKVTITTPRSNNSETFTVQASSKFEAKEKARHSQSIYRDVQVAGDILEVVKINDNDL